MMKNFRIIFFWGTAWGALEATFDYILHSVALNIGWLFWFPIGFFFMNKVYKQTGNNPGARWAIIYTSFIAAAIKLSNLLFHTGIDRVINPAVSIIFEGIAVFFVFKILERKERFFRLNYFYTLVLSISLRILYVLYLLLFPLYLTANSPLRGMNPLVTFIFLESAVNSIIIYFYISLFDKKYEEVKANSIILDPFVSIAMLVTAVFFQIGC